MKQIIYLSLTFIVFFTACSNSNSDKEKELLKLELELAKKELELKNKEEQLNEVENETEETPQPNSYTERNPMASSLRAKNIPDPIENTLEKEKKHPMDYLKLDFNFDSETYRKGLGALKIRTEKKRKYVAKGSIYNNATYATYKDATIEVRYRSDNGSIVGTQRLKLNTYMSPKKSTQFKYDLNVPNGTQRVSGNLISVVSVN